MAFLSCRVPFSTGSQLPKVAPALSLPAEEERTLWATFPASRGRSGLVCPPQAPSCVYQALSHFAHWFAQLLRPGCSYHQCPGCTIPSGMEEQQESSRQGVEEVMRRKKCLASSCPMGERNSCRGVPAGSRRVTVESPAAPRTGWVTTQVRFGLSVYKGDEDRLTGWRESSEGKSPCWVPVIRVQFLEPTAVGKNRLPKVNL